MAEDQTGKRRLKRLRLEAAVEHAELVRLEHEAKGVVWVGITKAALQKQAGVGKNYIDMLAPADELANRIKPLIRRTEKTREKRSVEQTRLERNRELQRQLALQARENHELMSQLNRARSELERVRGRLTTFERHYETQNLNERDQKLGENSLSGDLNVLPKGKDRTAKNN